MKSRRWIERFSAGVCNGISREVSAACDANDASSISSAAGTIAAVLRHHRDQIAAHSMFLTDGAGLCGSRKHASVPQRT